MAEYRLPFLDRLAAIPEIDLTCYYGQARSGTVSVGEVPHGVAVHRTRNMFWPFGQLRVMWQRGTLGLIRGNYDVIVCGDNIHNLSVWAVSLWPLLGTGGALVVFGFGYRPLSSSKQRRPFYRATRTALMRRADALLAYTDRGKQAWIELGALPSSVFVANNTLDTEQLIELAGTSEEQTTPRRGKGLDHFRVAFLGRLRPNKHVDVLIEAARHLKSQGMGLSLLIIGDGSEMANLKRQARGLPDVEFLGAIYDPQALAEVLAAAQVLALPGRVGLAVIHGFANGLPVITSHESVVLQSPEYDYIVPEQNGLIVDRLDAKAYAEMIADLMVDPERLRALQGGALHSARALSMDAMVDAFVESVRYAAAARRR